MEGPRMTKMREVRKCEMHLNVTLIEFATERQIKESLFQKSSF